MVSTRNSVSSFTVAMNGMSVHHNTHVSLCYNQKRVRGVYQTSVWGTRPECNVARNVKFRITTTCEESYSSENPFSEQGLLTPFAAQNTYTAAAQIYPGASGCARAWAAPMPVCSRQLCRSVQMSAPQKLCQREHTRNTQTHCTGDLHTLCASWALALPSQGSMEACCPVRQTRGFSRFMLARTLTNESNS